MSFALDVVKKIEGTRYGPLIRGKALSY